MKADSRDTKLTAYEVDCVRDGHKCCDPRRLRGLRRGRLESGTRRELYAWGKKDDVCACV